jgi:hypothetical protein
VDVVGGVAISSFEPQPVIDAAKSAATDRAAATKVLGEGDRFIVLPPKDA